MEEYEYILKPEIITFCEHCGKVPKQNGYICDDGVSWCKMCKDALGTYKIVESFGPKN